MLFKNFIKKRVFKTILHFDIAVLLFAVIAIMFNHVYALSDWVFSLSGWTSIGNSNWFIFDIIILYVFAYIGLKVVERYKIKLTTYLMMQYIMVFAFSVVMFRLKDGQLWWCDTLLAFPTGMLWSVYKSRIEKYFTSQVNYFIALICVALLFGWFYALSDYRLIFIELKSALFGILIMMISMRLHIGNSILRWVGINAFAIYILQRIPMIIAKEFGFHDSPFLFLCIVVPSSLIMALVFTKSLKKIDSIIISNKSKKSICRT